jgi:glycosyltransferase involved in cell wall biosynthesis
MRVLIIEPAGLLWGSERALIDLLSHVDRERFDVTVVCPAQSPLLDELDRLRVTTMEAPLDLLHIRGRLARAKAAAALASVVWRVEPHVVHLNQAGLLRTVAFACHLSGAPLICHVRLLEDARRLYERRSLWLGAKQYIAISDAVCAQLQGGPGVGRSTISRIYDPLDESAMKSRAEEKRPGELREELSIPPHARVVAHIGRLCADKRQDLLIEAAGMLDADDIHFVIVGAEPPPPRDAPSYRNSLERRAEELGVRGKVLFTGMRSDVPAIMRMSDVVVLTSAEEALGRVLLEALSLGKPIIGPAAGGPAEIIGADERGLAFEVGKPASFANCILATFKDPVSAAARAQRGNAWVRATCAPSHHARQIEKAYAQAARLPNDSPAMIPA